MLDSPADPENIVNDAIQWATTWLFSLRTRESRALIMTEAISPSQSGLYRKAIRKLLMRGTEPLSPNLLFGAADTAVPTNPPVTPSKVGIFLGTMNPVHHGHIHACVAAIAEEKLERVLIAPGGTVPDKPFCPPFPLRSQMVMLAVREKNISEWLRVTAIRHQILEMFLRDPDLLMNAGADWMSKRKVIDIAALIWLFRANRHIEWTFLIGSDKIGGYGRKEESALIVETLGDARANARIVYYSRPGEEVDIAKDIVPYPWLFKRWEQGYFVKARVPTVHLASSDIRAAIVTGQSSINGVPLDRCMSRAVLSFMHGSQELLRAYEAEFRTSRASVS